MGSCGGVRSPTTVGLRSHRPRMLVGGWVDRSIATLSGRAFCRFTLRGRDVLPDAGDVRAASDSGGLCQPLDDPVKITLLHLCGSSVCRSATTLQVAAESTPKAIPRALTRAPKLCSCQPRVRGSALQS